MKLITLLLCSVVYTVAASAQKAEYPYPVSFLRLQIEGRPAKMAYMDVKPASANGSSVLLFHGKNFNGYYWKAVIRFLSDAGFRVIVPDQLGFGKSDKPDIHYSFSMMAANTKKLLDTLRIDKINVVGHSMGGMLATRFALMYPAAVQKLIFENPIGLEDYRLFVPYRSIDEQYAQEQKSDFNSLKKYQQGYYPEWKPEYEQYATAQYEALQIPDFKSAAFASALTYDMMYQQPVVYELKYIKTPTLLIIGQADRTIVGKNLLTKKVSDQHGQYPQLGRFVHEQIAGSRLIELPGVGHIPHIQAPDAFKKAVLGFLK